MKLIFELSARVNEGETAETKHIRTITALKQVKAPWGLGDVDIPFPGFGTKSVVQVHLSKYIGKGIKSSIFYRYRNMLDDNSLCDDRMYLEINSGKIDYQDLADNIFPKYVEIFDAYSAVIYNQDLMFEDFNKSRNINLRETIFRFYPVCFYDQNLCSRALRMPVSDIVKKLSGKIIISILGNGIFINNPSVNLTIDEMNKFDSEVSSYLKR